ncbi:hypothetical protein TNIN_239581 [Trichonephila inaurata madagascariensis]|uniref:Uncharacterized protein n=1 Tax=Trichonephila inaurata madagascariensis TaxID=2747483 RepID=A0A8X7BU62_9ARAC|nr:hypothetical protein TNIN_239581 [Trichonephila inaurata madagascariensis]
MSTCSEADKISNVEKHQHHQTSQQCGTMTSGYMKERSFRLQIQCPMSNTRLFHKQTLHLLCPLPRRVQRLLGLVTLHFRTTWDDVM